MNLCGAPTSLGAFSPPPEITPRLSATRQIDRRDPLTVTDLTNARRAATGALSAETRDFQGFFRRRGRGTGVEKV